MLMVVEIPGHEFNSYEVNATQKKQLCCKKGFNDKIDCLITALKAGGRMSPKLRSFTKETRAKVSLYEFKLALFGNKGAWFS